MILAAVAARAADVSSANIEAKLARNHVWTFGLGSARYLMNAHGENDLKGFAGSVSLGYGYLQDRWFFHGTIDQILGPYVPVREGEVNVDYGGTGFSLWTGVSFEAMDLRSKSGGYGVAIGMNYLDIVGRQIGRNRKASEDPYDVSNFYLTQNYKSKVTSLSVVPAFFATWLSDSRPQGNKPELLKTRIEGVMTTIGFAIPMASYYRNQYVTRKDTEDGRTRVVEVIEKGSYVGFSVILSCNVLLGT